MTSTPDRSSTDQESLLSLEAQLELALAERDELRRQLLQAQKLGTVGALASSITHEFNNILMTVINYARMGLRHKDAVTREKAFEKILSAGQRASKITSGILSYSRQGSDRREPRDLSILIQDVLILVEKDLQKHRIQLQFNAIDPAWANVNAGQIQQVLMNLIVNARQAMENGGQLIVTLKSDRETGFAEISLRDTGEGIPTDVLNRIFEPYFTTKNADANGQGGSGIGLALCREIIEGHQGRIRVETTVGKGTTFTLKLPEVPPNQLTSTGTALRPISSASRENRSVPRAG